MRTENGYDVTTCHFLCTVSIGLTVPSILSLCFCFVFLGGVEFGSSHTPPPSEKDTDVIYMGITSILNLASQWREYLGIELALKEIQNPYHLDETS